jgi:transketolase
MSPGRSMREQFADTMVAVGQSDPRLTVLISDISHFILQPFARACPGRFYNLGICEGAIVSLAAGMAKTGMFPVIHTIAPFIIERAFEQLKLDFCYQQLCGNLVTVGSAFDYANLGCSHHCYDDFALLKCLPGTRITYPASALEFDLLFRQGYRGPGLTHYRLPAVAHQIAFLPSDIQLGRGIKVVEGDNLTIVATGPQLDNALAARDELGAIGWHPEIIYIHTIAPLDFDLLRASAGRTRRVLVVEEHLERGGLGDEVLRATRDIAGLRFASLAIPNRFSTDYGSYAQHCERWGFSREGIVAKVKAEFGG